MKSTEAKSFFKTQEVDLDEWNQYFTMFMQTSISGDPDPENNIKIKAKSRKCER